MRLDFLHGVVDHWSPAMSVDRLYVSRASLAKYLARRESRYEGWSAGGPTGDALSVDDATRAGAAACLLARELGHEVVFFVNPMQIATGQPYFFSVLDACLDGRTRDAVTYEGERFELRDAAEIRRFRTAVKAKLMTLPADDSLREAELLRERLATRSAALPAHLMPISLDELGALRRAGVRIENHGWSHVEIGALDDAGFKTHVASARAWLHEHAGIESRIYAVPFGLTDVAPRRRPFVGDAYVLADPALPQGKLNAQCWNRFDLTQRLREA